MNRRLAGVKPSATLALTAKANALRAQGKDVIAFTAGEPDLPTPKHICDAAKAAIDAGHHHYTPAEGVPALRKAIAQKLERENGLGYAQDEIIACAGGKQAIMDALVALCDLGDEVIVPSPYWVSTPEQVRLASAKPVIVPTDEGVARARIIEEHVTQSTRAIILSSPGNPAGSLVPEDELERIAALARKRDLWIISDEVYEHLVFEGEHASIAKHLPERVITVGSCSKTYAMTGWRLGWAAGPRDVVRLMGTVQSHMTSGPSSISQHAAIAALAGPQDCVRELHATFAKRRELLLRLLHDLGLPHYPPHGAFYAFVDISATGLSSEEFASRLLEEQLVALVPGKPFGSDNHVRLSYACSQEAIREGLSRIKRFLEGLG